MAFCTLGWHLHFRELSSAVLIYAPASWLPTWHQFAPSPSFGQAGSLYNALCMWIWRSLLPPDTLLEDEFDCLHFHTLLAVSWQCPGSVLAVCSPCLICSDWWD